MNEPFYEAAQTLAFMGAEALPPLVSSHTYIHNTGEAQARNSCIHYILELDTEDSIYVLARLMREASADIRISAMDYLREAITTFAKINSGTTVDWDEILQCNGVREGIIEIIMATQDQDPKIRSVATKYLQNLAKQSTPIHRVAIELAEHPDAQMRLAGSNVVQLISDGNQ